MPLSVYTTVEPASEPVTLTEVKAHLRINFTDEDALIQNLITTARVWMERGLGRALITQTKRAAFDLPMLTQAMGPSSGFIGDAPRLAFDLPFALPGHTATVSLVELENDVATWTTVDTTQWVLDSDNTPARVWLKAEALYLWLPSWSWVGFRAPRVRITYTCGYGTTETSVPAPIRAALLNAIGHLYENRESAGSLPDSLLPQSFMHYSL